MKQKQIIALVSATARLRWQDAAKHQKKTHRKQQ